MEREDTILIIAERLGELRSSVESEMEKESNCRASRLHSGRFDHRACQVPGHVSSPDGQSLYALGCVHATLVTDVLWDHASGLHRKCNTSLLIFFFFFCI